MDWKGVGRRCRGGGVRRNLGLGSGPLRQPGTSGVDSKACALQRVGRPVRCGTFTSPRTRTEGGPGRSRFKVKSRRPFGAAEGRRFSYLSGGPGQPATDQAPFHDGFPGAPDPRHRVQMDLRGRARGPAGTATSAVRTPDLQPTSERCLCRPGVLHLPRGWREPPHHPVHNAMREVTWTSSARMRLRQDPAVTALLRLARRLAYIRAYGGNRARRLAELHLRRWRTARALRFHAVPRPSHARLRQHRRPIRNADAACRAAIRSAGRTGRPSGKLGSAGRRECEGEHPVHRCGVGDTSREGLRRRPDASALRRADGPEPFRLLSARASSGIHALRPGGGQSAYGFRNGRRLVIQPVGDLSGGHPRASRPGESSARSAAHSLRPPTAHPPNQTGVGARWRACEAGRDDPARLFYRPSSRRRSRRARLGRPRPR